MFSLIITIVSIALVVAITMATFYFGGSEVISKGQDEAQASRAINELVQIQNALFSYNATEGQLPANLSQLVEKNHIKELPQGWDSQEVEVVGKLHARLLGLEGEQGKTVCELINTKLNLNYGEGEIPSCSEVGSNFRGCCDH